MSLSELRKRKVVRAFHACDLTKNGQLTIEDWVIRTKRVAAAFGIEEESEKYERLNRYQMRDWKQIQQSADINRDNVITLDEWIQAHERIWAPEMKDNFVAGLRESCDALWEFIDANGDGCIDLDEFTRYNQGYVDVGADDSWIVKVFQAMDADGDGTISKEEYIAAAVAWAYSEDLEASGNGLFGPY